MAFTLKEIAEATGGRIIGDPGVTATAVSTDSRSLAASSR